MKPMATYIPFADIKVAQQLRKRRAEVELAWETIFNRYKGKLRRKNSLINKIKYQFAIVRYCLAVKAAGY